MKILLINDFWERGGAEVYTRELMKLLQEKGHEVRMVVFDNENISVPDNVVVIKENKKKIWRDLGSLINFRVKRELDEIIEKFDPEVIHINSNGKYPLAVIDAAKKSGKRVIQTVHDFRVVCANAYLVKNGQECPGGIGMKCLNYECKDKYHTGHKSWIKYCYNVINHFLSNYLTRNRVDEYITPTNNLKDCMSLHKYKNITQIYNYVDIEDNSKQEIETEINQKELIFVGRVSVEKGIVDLIKAVQVVKEKHPDIKLKIIGEGDDEEKIKSLVKKLELRKNVILKGFIKNSDLWKYYKSARAIVIPSKWRENNSLVLLESLKFGIPIIASNIGGNKEVLEKIPGNYLFKVGEIKDLSDKIEQVMKSNNLKINNREKYLKKFSREHHYRELMKVYEGK